VSASDLTEASVARTDSNGLSQTTPAPVAQREEYRIGPGDLLDIAVLEAPEMNRSLRVSAGGEISMPLVGPVKLEGLTPQTAETAPAELLRKGVMNDPHVIVFVHEMESHPVSVTGSVKKPGVLHFRGPKGLLEVIAMAEGLADDAGAICAPKAPRSAAA
jgi:polysaccharide biosynthesis/export protein